MSDQPRPDHSATPPRCDLEELQAAIALRHVRLVPETRYGREVIARITEDVKDLVGVKRDV